MTLLQIQHVSKFFGKSQALDDITMSINAGEVHAIIGENGAGKSTLIKILTGVYLPSEGSLHWQGTPVKIESPKHAHDLAFMRFIKTVNSYHLLRGLKISICIFLIRKEGFGLIGPK